MALTADEALAQFKEGRDVEEVKRKFPELPTINIKKSNPGSYVSGIIRAFRETTVGDITYYFLTLKLQLTDIQATKRGKEKGTYEPVEAKEGDDVTIVCPIRLARDVKDLLPGTEVFIKFLGKTTEKEGKRMVTANRFDVRAPKTEKPF